MPTIYSFPLSRNPSECEWKPFFNTRLFRSPYSRSAKTLELPGLVWTVTATYENLKESEIAQLEKWFGDIRGSGGRFNYGPPHRQIAQGSAKSLGIYTPRVNGAAQLGTQLVTDGWPPSTSNLLIAGDYFAYDNSLGYRELKLVSSNVSSDGGGNATLLFSEPIRKSPPDNNLIIVASPTCTMLVSSDEKLSVSVKPPIRGSFTLDAMEFF